MEHMEYPTEDDAKKLNDYRRRCDNAFRELFKAARHAEELQFAFALSPEMRGLQDAGWNTAYAARDTVKDYESVLGCLPADSRARVRIALSLYAHLSEASGLYETLKNMMRLVSGEGYKIVPFQHLVERYKQSGAVVSPNANKIMKDLIGHAIAIGRDNIRDLIQEAFDPDIRNAYAHADYILRPDDIRIRNRNGGFPQRVSYPEFYEKLNKAVMFFESQWDAIANAKRSYSEPRRIIARMNNNEPPMPTIISFDAKNGRFKTGPHL